MGRWLIKSKLKTIIDFLNIAEFPCLPNKIIGGCLVPPQKYITVFERQVLVTNTNYLILVKSLNP